MLKIKDVMRVGYKIQLRREEVIEDFLKSVWIEKDGVGKAIAFEDFNLALSNSDSINEFEEKLIELNPIYLRKSI